MKPIKVAIADDHVLFRKGLVSLLEGEDNVQIVLEAGTGTEILQRMKNIDVDVVLMDIEMADMDGITATQKIRELSPEVRVVMLSAFNEKSLILHAIENGARGYLLKDSDPADVVEAVKTVMQNGFCFNNEISHLLLRGIVEKDNFQAAFNPKPQLTDREMEVLQLICKEMTSIEIGDQLCLSPRTVETYRKNLIEKIGARNTVGIVLYALKNKLVDVSV